MYVESLPSIDARNHPACIILFCMYTYKVEIPWASWLIVLSLLKLLFIFSCAIRNFGFRKKWKHRMNSVCQQNSAFSAFSFGSHLINVIHFKSTQIPFLRAYVLSQYRVSLEFYLDRILRIFDIFFLPFSFTAKLYEPQLYPHISFVCFNHSVQYWYSSSPVITFLPNVSPLTLHYGRSGLDCVSHDHCNSVSHGRVTKGSTTRQTTEPPQPLGPQFIPPHPTLLSLQNPTFTSLQNGDFICHKYMHITESQPIPQMVYNRMEWLVRLEKIRLYWSVRTQRMPHSSFPRPTFPTIDLCHLCTISGTGV